MPKKQESQIKFLAVPLPAVWRLLSLHPLFQQHFVALQKYPQLAAEAHRSEQHEVCPFHRS